MKASEIIKTIEQEGHWVDWNQTRDIMLFGDADVEVKNIGVCWVATNKVLKEAAAKHINFIISHENMFYDLSTAPKKALKDSVEDKKAFMKKHGISVYRCHDVWDKIPHYGVSDQWAKRLGYAFEQREINSFYQCAKIPEQKVEEVAKHIATALKQDGENGVYVFGDINKKVETLAMGTGAATDIYTMLKFKPDAVIVSDDGITNWNAGQYAIDQNLPMIVVNHATCEICGLKAMAQYLQDKFAHINVTYLHEGYDIQYFLAD